MTKWTAKEKKLLAQRYPISTPKQLLKVFTDKTLQQIYTEANYLGIKKKSKYNKELLKEKYSYYTNEELLEFFPNMTKKQIAGWGKRLGLRKTQEVLSRTVSQANKKKEDAWKDEDISLLIRFYPHKTNKEMLKILTNKNIKQIPSKAHLMGLKKTSETFLRVNRERSESNKGKHCGKKNGMYGKPTPRSKGNIRPDLNHYVRSSYEANIARLMKFLNKSYVYEKYTFELIAIDSTYTPDFYILEDDLFIEVKGYWREQAKRKFKAFKKEYPNIKIFLIDKELYIKLEKLLESIIPNWE